MTAMSANGRKDTGCRSWVANGRLQGGGTGLRDAWVMQLLQLCMGCRCQHHCKCGGLKRLSTGAAEDRVSRASSLLTPAVVVWFDGLGLGKQSGSVDRQRNKLENGCGPSRRKGWSCRDWAVGLARKLRCWHSLLPAMFLACPRAPGSTLEV